MKQESPGNSPVAQSRKPTKAEKIDRSNQLTDEADKMKFYGQDIQLVLEKLLEATTLNGENHRAFAKIASAQRTIAMDNIDDKTIYEKSLKAAIEAAKKAVKDKDNLWGKYNLAKLESMQEKNEAKRDKKLAEKMQEIADAKVAKTFEDHLAQAYALFYLHGTEAEIGKYQQLSLMPEFTEDYRAHYTLGAALKEENRLAEAELSFAKAVQYAPNFGWAWYDLGRVQSLQHKWVEAEKSLREAVKYSPKNGDAFGELGTVITHQADAIYESQGREVARSRFQEAEDVLKEAHKLIPDNTGILDELTFVLGRQEKYSEEIYYSEKILFILPDCPGAYLKIGNAYGEMKDYAKALAYYNKALGNNPDHVLSLAAKGALLSDLGHDREAIDTINKLVALYNSGCVSAEAVGLKNYNGIKTICTTIRSEVLDRMNSTIDQLESMKTTSDMHDPLQSRFEAEAKAIKEEQHQLTKQLTSAFNPSSGIELSQEQLQQVLGSISLLQAKVDSMQSYLTVIQQTEKMRSEIDKDSDLRDYYFGVAQTLAELFTGSLAVGSGKVKVDTSNMAVDVISSVLRSLPFGEAAGRVLKTVQSTLKSGSIKNESANLTKLAPNTSEFDELVTKVMVPFIHSNAKLVKLHVADTNSTQAVKGFFGKMTASLTKAISNISTATTKILYGQKYDTTAKEIGHTHGLMLAHMVEQNLIPTDNKANTELALTKELSNLFSSPDKLVSELAFIGEVAGLAFDTYNTVMDIHEAVGGK